MDKEFPIIFSEAADETYNLIFTQIAERWGESVALKFQNKMFDTLKVLSNNPLIFKSIKGQPNIRKGLVNKNCSFFYEVTSSEIFILYFWDNRQKPLL